MLQELVMNKGKNGKKLVIIILYMVLIVTFIIWISLKGIILLKRKKFKVLWYLMLVFCV